MSIDAIAISAIIIAVIGALATFVKTVHLKKCHSACCDSDCTDKRTKSPPETPVAVEPTERATITLTEDVTEV